MIHWTWLVASAALAAGCAKQDAAGGGGACPPLSVTVDGTALAAMPIGLARSNNTNGDISYEVEVFNHDKTTCEQMTSKSGRQVPDGEISVRAFAGGKGMLGAGVGIDAHTQATSSVMLGSPKPAKPGDIVKVCVRDVTFKPAMGDYKGKQIKMAGLLEGRYCGELTF